MKNLAGVTCGVLAGCIIFAPFVAVADDAVSRGTVDQNIETLIKTNSCRECNLRGANLNRLELQDADLEGADLTRAKLYLANLAGANLRNSKLREAGFGGADLGGADLRGADLTGASLNGAYTVGAQFDNEKIANAHRPGGSSDTGGLDEDEINPEPAEKAKNISAASEDSGKQMAAIVKQKRSKTSDESAGRMRGETPEVGKKDISVVKATDTGPAIVNAVDEVPSPKTVKPLKAVEVDAALAEPVARPVPAETVKPALHKESAKSKTEVVTQMEEDSQAGTHAETPAVDSVENEKMKNRSRLEEKKKCYGCDLAGLDFSKMDLRKVDLEKADLTGCTFSGADLRGGNFKGAVIINAVFNDADLRGADFYKADLSGTDFSGAKMKGAIFEDTQLYGVVGLSRE